MGAGEPNTHRPWPAGPPTNRSRSCSAKRSSWSWSAGIWKTPRSSHALSSSGNIWSEVADLSLCPSRPDSALDRRDGVLADDIRGACPIEDREPSPLGQSIVVRGHSSKEGEVFESNPGWSVLDPLDRESGRYAQEDREIRRENPSAARVLQKANRIPDDADQARALVRVGGVHIPITNHELAPLDVGPDHRDMRGAIREEQKRLREDVHVLLNPSTDGVAQPTGGRLARQENGMTAGPERLCDESAHRRLPGAIDALEGDEPGEQARGERMR
jgi:hypothetical protein